MPELLAQTTTTTEVPRVVGDHPGTLPVVAAGGALFAVIAAASLYASRRARRSGVVAVGPDPKKGGG